MRNFNSYLNAAEILLHLCILIGLRKSIQILLERQIANLKIYIHYTQYSKPFCNYFLVIV